jgi:two-component system NarL family sensor kinase
METASPKRAVATEGASKLGVVIAPDDDAEALLRSTLDALSAHVAVLDETGTIVAVNQAWRAFADATGYVGKDHGVGTNYLAVCESGAEQSRDAARTARALREIIAGTRTAFRMEYPCIGPTGPLWFQLRVTCPRQSQVRRIVIAHEDITDVKLAEESLARLSARILQLQDEERKRIARELHDTTAQNLLVISLNAARLYDQVADEGEQARRLVAEILQSAEQSLQEVRTLSYLLHPPLLDDIGLASALRWLARGFGERSGVAVETRIDELPEPLSADAATTLFRVAQEALSNVHRHSGSPWARIALRHQGDAVLLDVEDRGRGMAAPSEEGAADVQSVGVGISGMRVRLEQLGGRVELSPRNPGLLLRAVLPLEKPGAARDPDADRASA